MGHSIPESDKRALIAEFRKNSTAPVLALHRMGDSRLDGAEQTITPDHPELLLEAVEKIFAERRPSAAGSN